MWGCGRSRSPRSSPRLPRPRGRCRCRARRRTAPAALRTARRAAASCRLARTRRWSARATSPTRTSAVSARRRRSLAFRFRYSSAVSTLPAAERWGIRWNCWNTNPMESPRSAERRASSRPATSMPSTRTMPEFGRSRQPSSPSIVDFPDPDGPTIDMKSPAWIGGVPRSGLQPRRVLVELHLADPHQRDWLRPLSSAGILVFLADEG